MGFTREAGVTYLKKLENQNFLHSKRKGRKVWYYVPTDIVYTLEGELGESEVLT